MTRPSLVLGARAALFFVILMGWQESIMRSVVADLAPKEKRASAFGVFNTGCGILWFAGSAVIGLVYGSSILAVALFCLGAQLLSLPFPRS